MLKTIDFYATRSLTVDKFLFEFIVELASRNYHVSVCVFDPENLTGFEGINNIEIVSDLAGSCEVDSIGIRFFQIFRRMCASKPDLIVTNTPLISALVRVVNFIFRVKLVYFVHGFRFYSGGNVFRNFLFQSLEKIFGLGTTGFVVINSEDLEWCSNSFPRKPVLYLEGGVGVPAEILNFDKGSPAKSERHIFRILVISAYKKEKGYEDVLLLAKKFDSCQIQIDCFGYGDASWLLRKIEALDLGGVVCIKGFDTNVLRYVGEYDLFLHCSRREGLPVSVMEMMTLGLAVCCTNVRGCRDLVSNYHTGFLYEPGNVDSLIRILNQLTTCDNVRDDVVSAARDLARVRFDRTKLAKRFCDFIE